MAIQTGGIKQWQLNAYERWLAHPKTSAIAKEKFLTANPAAPKLAIAQLHKAHNEVKKHRPKFIDADTSGSTAFSDLYWEDGVAYATFTDGSFYAYDMSRSEFKEWADDDSLGGYFNEEIR